MGITPVGVSGKDRHYQSALFSSPFIQVTSQWSHGGWNASDLAPNPTSPHLQISWQRRPELSWAMIELGFDPRAIGGNEPVSERWDSEDSCEYQGRLNGGEGPKQDALVCVHGCMCVHVCVNVESLENICSLQ